MPRWSRLYRLLCFKFIINICRFRSSFMNCFWKRITFLKNYKISPFLIFLSLLSSNISLTASTAGFVLLNVLPCCFIIAFCRFPPIGTGPPPPPRFLCLFGGSGCHCLFSSWMSLVMNSLISSLRYSCIESESIYRDNIMSMGVSASIECLISSM